MPIFPLPPHRTGIPIDAGRLPVSSVDDVTPEWDTQIQDAEDAPIRDAIQAGQTAMQIEYQRRSRFAAAQSDRLRATGEYLDEILGEENGIQRQTGEADPSYRKRGNAFPGTVDPDDIVAAANAVLAPFTAISARYFEHSDGLFLSDGTTTWSCHLFNGQGNQPPNYPDRRYSKIPNRRPGGARIFNDAAGRFFGLLVPEIAAIDANVTALFDGTETDPNDGVFLSSGGATSDKNVSFMWSIEATSFDVYNAVVSAVEAIRGQSIRWLLLSDPQLKA